MYYEGGTKYAATILSSSEINVRDRTVKRYLTFDGMSIRKEMTEVLYELLQRHINTINTKYFIIILYWGRTLQMFTCLAILQLLMNCHITIFSFTIITSGRQIMRFFLHYHVQNGSEAYRAS
jgi:hypothetical protein